MKAKTSTRAEKKVLLAATVMITVVLRPLTNLDRWTILLDMVAGVIQECPSLLSSYPKVAREASIRACFIPGLDPLRLGVQIGDIGLQKLLHLPLNERRKITERGPTIDWYLGNTRVYKRTTRILLFAFCPDIGRHMVPREGRFVIQLPQGFSNVLAVKLSVVYMELYILDEKIRSAPWKVGNDVSTYIYLADLFAHIGMSGASRDLEGAILRRFRESPLRIEDMRAIWNRDSHNGPSKYAGAMADNIVTFMCVPKMHLFARC